MCAGGFVMLCLAVYPLARDRSLLLTTYLGSRPATSTSSGLQMPMVAVRLSTVCVTAPSTSM
jgi:hypothetical protein